MLVNLSDVFASSDKEEKKEVSYEASSFVHMGETVEVIDCPKVLLTFSAVEKGKIRITGVGEIHLRMNCSRCLEPVEQTVSFEIDRVVYAPDRLDEETKEEQSFIENYSLNVEDLINDEILLSMPMKVLCKEDCKGICMVCGKNLNLGECGCDRFVPDPRMAAIKDIFEAR